MTECIRSRPTAGESATQTCLKPLEGYWFDRTKEYAARNRGEDFGVMKYASREELVLSPLPCWEHLSPKQYRERVAGLIRQIETEGRSERESKGLQPLGVEAVLRQNPTTRPSRTKKSPAPRVHAASTAVRKGFREAYRAFVAAFREAAERLKAGDRSARFPIGSFPPALPFVSPFPARPP